MAIRQRKRTEIRFYKVTTIYVRKLCPLYSLVGLAIVVRKDDFICRSSIPNGRIRMGRYVQNPCARTYAPATTVLYNSLNCLDYGVNVLTTVCTALLVPFTALCATFFAVIAVLFATFLAVRTGPA
jgi:hypothetical protein